MTDLREIAENLTQDCPEPARGYIKTLLDAVVEAEARFDFLQNVIAEKEPANPNRYYTETGAPTDLRECWELLLEKHKNGYRNRACHRLNLDGVWSDAR